MIDWNKPIETATGKPAFVTEIDEGEHKVNFKGSSYHWGLWTYDDGSCNIKPSTHPDEWPIRNVVDNDELAELRAFRDRAIESYPDLAEPETDEQAAKAFAREACERNSLLANVQAIDDDKIQEHTASGVAYDVIKKAIAWARANPR